MLMDCDNIRRRHDCLCVIKKGPSVGRNIVFTDDSCVNAGHFVTNL